MMVRQCRTRLVLSVCVLALTLSGCGGGGGGGSTARPEPIAAPAPPPPPPPPVPVPPPPPPPPAPAGGNFNDSEYARSNGANFEGAIGAYNAGATGKGVKIALVDTGINPALHDFAGKVDPASQDVVASRGIADTEGHGTATAAVAAAARDGLGMLGVAFEATIVSLNTSDPTDCPDTGCTHSSVAIAKAVDLARIAGVKVINISLGGKDSSAQVNSAIARAAAAGIVVVMSAGNGGADPGGANPEGFALGASQNSNVIIAGAVDSNRNIASFSNRAGSGAASYLTALGVRVTAPDQTGALAAWSGTSFSAPIISGAVALLAGAFPNLTGQQIISILYTSADDAGTPGIDPVYGHGILNISRAFQPLGALSLPDGKTAVDPGSASGSASTPMGDASPRLAGVIILDGFSRAFVVNFARSLRRAPLDQPLADGLQPGLSTATAGAGPAAVSITVRRNLAGQPEVGMAQLGLTAQDARKARLISGLAVSRIGPRTAVALGFSESGRSLQQRLVGSADHAFLVARDPLARMGFYGTGGTSIAVRQRFGRFGLTVTGERGTIASTGLGPRLADPGYSIASATLDRRFGRAALTLGASRLDEQGTMLGARFSRLVGAGAATSWFVDAGARLDLGRGWGADAGYRRGWTSGRGLGALAQSGRLSSDAWSFDIAKHGFLQAGDSFALRVMQPLRVRSGGFGLDVPVSYDYATLTAGYQKQLFSLAPAGREIDVEAAYGMRLLHGVLTANLFVRRDPGNVASLDPDLGAAIRYTLGF